MAVTPTDESRSRASGRALRVLIADEDRDALDGLAGLLGDLGHEVLSKAISVHEAAEVIAAEDPDLAIVRLHRDEEHALRMIQQILEYASGPVIALLDEDDTDFIPAAAAEGVDAFAQPVTRGTVQGAIELAMRRHAELEALGERVEQLQTALERRAIIERAKGILMERHGIDDAAAFELLRSRARATNRKVVDLARAVADGHALLPGA
jgi:AmiR/NasT family two-component response regulator